MKYLFLNHKMNLNPKDCLTYKKEFSKLNWDNIEVAVFPTYINIPYLIGEKYEVGAQNTSQYKEGAYTGEVSAKQLSELQIKYCLVGHSERRNLFQETEEETKEKILRLQEQGIIPVLCVGEIEKEKRQKVLEQQITLALEGVEIKNLIVAYEPVYSIGTGKVLENKEIEEAITFIKNLLKEKYNQDTPVLYGGSVNEKNIAYLNEISNVDGFLVGNASLNTEQIKRMIEGV